MGYFDDLGPDAIRPPASVGGGSGSSGWFPGAPPPPPLPTSPVVGSGSYFADLGPENFIPPTPPEPLLSKIAGGAKNLYEKAMGVIGLPHRAINWAADQVLSDKTKEALGEAPGGDTAANWVWRTGTDFPGVVGALTGLGPTVKENLAKRAATVADVAKEHPDLARAGENVLAFENSLGQKLGGILTDPVMFSGIGPLSKFGTALFAPGMAMGVKDAWDQGKAAYDAAGGRITPEVAAAAGGGLIDAGMLALMGGHALHERGRASAGNDLWKNREQIAGKPETADEATVAGEAGAAGTAEAAVAGLEAAPAERPYVPLLELEAMFPGQVMPALPGYGFDAAGLRPRATGPQANLPDTPAGPAAVFDFPGYGREEPAPVPAAGAAPEAASPAPLPSALPAPAPEAAPAAPARKLTKKQLRAQQKAEAAAAKQQPPAPPTPPPPAQEPPLAAPVPAVPPPAPPAPVAPAAAAAPAAATPEPSAPAEVAAAATPAPAPAPAPAPGTATAPAGFPTFREFVEQTAARTGLSWKDMKQGTEGYKQVRAAYEELKAQVSRPAAPAAPAPEPPPAPAPAPVEAAPAATPPEAPAVARKKKGKAAKPAPAASEAAPAPVPAAPAPVETGGAGPAPRPEAAPAEAVPAEAAPAVTPPETQPSGLGERVVHERYGNGTVVERDPATNMSTVKFDNGKTVVVDDNKLANSTVPAPASKEAALAPEVATEAAAAETAAPVAERRVPTDLRSAVQKYIEDNPNATREELNAEIKHLRDKVETDQLTGIKNRAGWDRIATTITPNDHAVMVDLKKFKPINDQFGHAVGDQALQQVARILEHHLGNDLARYGGDEFSGILRGEHTPEALAAVEANIRRDLQAISLRAKQKGTRKFIDISPVDAHIGFGKTIEEADAAANAAAAASRQGGRGDVGDLTEGTHPSERGADAGTDRRPEPGVRAGAVRGAAAPDTAGAPPEPGVPPPPGNPDGRAGRGVAEPARASEPDLVPGPGGEGKRARARQRPPVAPTEGTPPAAPRRGRGRAAAASTEPAAAGTPAVEPARPAPATAPASTEPAPAPARKGKGKGTGKEASPPPVAPAEALPAPAGSPKVTRLPPAKAAGALTIEQQAARGQHNVAPAAPVTQELVNLRGQHRDVTRQLQAVENQIEAAETARVAPADRPAQQALIDSLNKKHAALVNKQIKISDLIEKERENVTKKTALGRKGKKPGAAEPEPPEEPPIVAQPAGSRQPDQADARRMMKTEVSTAEDLDATGLKVVDLDEDVPVEVKSAVANSPHMQRLGQVMAVVHNRIREMLGQLQVVTYKGAPAKLGDSSFRGFLLNTNFQGIRMGRNDAAHIYQNPIEIYREVSNSPHTNKDNFSSRIAEGFIDNAIHENAHDAGDAHGKLTAHGIYQRDINGLLTRSGDYRKMVAAVQRALEANHGAALNELDNHADTTALYEAFNAPDVRRNDVATLRPAGEGRGSAEHDVQAAGGTGAGLPADQANRPGGREGAPGGGEGPGSSLAADLPGGDLGTAEAVGSGAAGERGRPEGSAPGANAGVVAQAQPARVTPAKLTKEISSNPDYAYHATNQERLYEMADSRELQTHRPSFGTDQQAWPDGSTEKRAYFSDKAGTVWQFAPEDGTPVVVRTPKAELRTENTGDLYSRKPVSSDKLEFLGSDGEWHPVDDLRTEASQPAQPGSAPGAYTRVVAQPATSPAAPRFSPETEDALRSEGLTDAQINAFAKAPRKVRPIPPGTVPGGVGSAPAVGESRAARAGSPITALDEGVSTGEPPRVEQNVEDFRSVDSVFTNAKEPWLRRRAKLLRDSPETWANLDPKIIDLAAKLTPDSAAEAKFINDFRNGRNVSAVNTQVMDALRHSAQEAHARAAGELQTAIDSGEDLGIPRINALEAAVQDAEMRYANAAQSNIQGRTRIARALAAGRRMMKSLQTQKPGVGDTDLFFKNLFKEGFEGMTDKKAAELLHLWKTKPSDFNDAIIAMSEPNLWDKYMEFWKNGLVSAPGTQVANIGGNTVELPLRVLETLTAEGLDRVTGSRGQRLNGEAAAEWQGIKEGATSGIVKLGKALNDIIRLHPEDLNFGTREIDAIPAIEGKFGRGVRIPFRMLGAFDDFFKEIGMSAEISKRAWRAAGGDPVLWKAIKRAPPKEILRDAHAAMLERVFQDPNTLADTLVKARSAHPWMQLVLPFIRTPLNIAHLTIERSPWGFVRAAKNLADYNGMVKRGNLPPERLAYERGKVIDSFARPLVGTAILAMFYQLAKNKLMTGSGPTDPKVRTELQDTGWQPYSFVFPGMGKEGGSLYLPFNRFEPVSSILGFAADMSEVQDEKTQGDIADKAIGSIAQNLTNKTFLVGFTEAANAISNPRRYASQYLTGLAGSVVPNIIAKTAQATDADYRDVSASQPGIVGFGEKVVKTIGSRIPGLSQELPQQSTALGLPKERTSALPEPLAGASRFLSPVQITEARAGDLYQVERELAKINLAPKPDRSMKLSGGKSIRLNEEEFNLVQSAYLDASKNMASVIKRSGWSKLPDTEDDATAPGQETKETVAKRIFNGAKRAARQRLYNDPGFRRRAARVQRGLEPEAS